MSALLSPPRRCSDLFRCPPYRSLRGPAPERCHRWPLRELQDLLQWAEADPRRCGRRCTCRRSSHLRVAVPTCSVVRRTVRCAVQRRSVATAGHFVSCRISCNGPKLTRAGAGGGAHVGAPLTSASLFRPVPLSAVPFVARSSAGALPPLATS